MIPILRDYLERLEDLHSKIWGAIADLQPEALDWVPGSGMNSLSVMVTHLTGAERYWIGDMAGEDPSGRIRETEFETGGKGADALGTRLAETLVHSRKVLEKLSLDDLEALRTSPRDGAVFTVAWCLAHALEHTALHLGHIEITRQLWDQHTKG